MAGFGTLAWARASNGRLSRREKLREIARGNQLVLRRAPGYVRQLIGMRNPRALHFDVDRIPVPDSATALAAEELCRESSPERLVNHCLRTYAWGVMLGHKDGLRPDPELHYVAAMLHDLALTDRFRDHSPMPCFAARAGLLATGWAQDRGWPEHRCATLGDAISLHLNAKVPAEHGPEAQLLQAGAAVDVLGLRHWELRPAAVAAVLERHPRLDFRDGLADFQAEARPGTRTQLLNRWLLFGTLFRHSPFERS